MGQFLKILGLAGLLCSVGYFLYYDQISTVNGFDYITRTRNFFAISATFVLLGYVTSFVESKLRIGSGKCKRCGRRTYNKEMYCFDHLKEAVNQAVDRDHRTGR